MGSPRAEGIERIRAIASRVVRGHGLELFDLQLRRESIGWVLRVFIDRPGTAAATAEESVGIEDCQRVSQDLGAVLDVEGESLDGVTGGQGYTLEVSSPGLDRPLRDEADYRRFTGRLAKVVVSDAVDGQMHFAGRLQGFEDGAVLLVEGRRTHRIPLDRIARGRLEVEYHGGRRN